ncbi:Amidase domain-containing protein [Mycobacterium sp. smrl_JER01]
MISVTADRARREADASDARRRRGVLRSALDGVPVAWKDLFDVAGTVTTAGSRLLCDGPVADRDGALVRRLSALGAVTVGKTNLSEFAFSGLGINAHFGTPLNPLNPALVPGGSSSGAAVAVATGLVPLALGTDTSGSVRVPAAFTGCIGYRASHQRYGRNDFRALSPSLDCVGVLARSMGDIEILDRLLCPGDAAAPVREAVIPAGEWVDDCTPGVRSAFDAAVERLRACGMVVTVRPMASMQRAQRLLDRHGTIVAADAYSAYGHLHGVEAATRRRLLHSADVSVGPVRHAMALERRSFREELDGAVLICPTVRHEPPMVQALLADDAAYDAANASTLRTTMVLSYLGTCGVSLPLPSAGLLISAPEGCDAAVLATADFCSRTVKA